MWDDVVIGTGNKGMSATCVAEVYPEIASNVVSFWITNAYLGGGMTVMRDTDEGQLLERLISEKASEAVLMMHARSMFIRYVKPDQLFKLTEQAIERAYARGSEERARTIRNALGLG